jgi:hypothetical protein
MKISVSKFKVEAHEDIFRWTRKQSREVGLWQYVSEKAVLNKKQVHIELVLMQEEIFTWKRKSF